MKNLLDYIDTLPATDLAMWAILSGMLWLMATETINHFTRKKH